MKTLALCAARVPPPASPAGEDSRPLRDSLEAALRRFLPRRGVPARLRAALGYTLFNAGKRLRPALVLETCRALGGDLRNAWPAACAVEFIHTYSLIHDDLPAMDDDDVRRGRPASHRKFGEATAILAGDALQAAAFEALSRTPDPSLAGPMAAVLAQGAGAAGMVGGQELDLSPQAGVARIHAKKTAALFGAAARLGALAAHSPRVDDLGRYGHHLGLAFQAVDDMQDEGKGERKNYAALRGREAARRRAVRQVAAAKAAVEFLGPRGIPLVRFADAIVSGG